MTEVVVSVPQAWIAAGMVLAFIVTFTCGFAVVMLGSR